MAGRQSARPLVEGAMLAVITVLLSFIPFAASLIPVPLIILVYRYDLRLGILSAITAALLAGMITGVFTGFIPLLITGLVGIAIGGALLEGFSPFKVLLVGTLAALMSFLLTILFSTLVFGQNLIVIFMDALEQGFEQAMQLYERMGVGVPSPLAEEGAMEQLMSMLRLMLPGLFFLSSVLLSFVNYAVARVILNRTGAELEWFPPFRTWRFPWYLAWGYIVGRLAVVFMSYLPVQAVVSLGLNVHLFFTSIFLIQGLAVVWFYLDRGRVARPLRYIIVFFLIFNPVFSELLSLGGVLDVWFDFRKLENKLRRD